MKFLYQEQEVESSLVRSLPNLVFPSQDIPRYQIIEQLGNITELVLRLDSDGIQRGVSPDLKEAFIVDENTILEKNLEKEFIKKTYTGGKDIQRFEVKEDGKYVIYTDRNSKIEHIPNILSHLSLFRDKITCKEVKQLKHPFYALYRPRNRKIFEKSSKIIGVITGDKIIVTLDEKESFPTDGLYILSSGNLDEDLVLIGFLNSKIATVLYQLFSNEKGKILSQIKPKVLEKLPIPRINANQKVTLRKIVEGILFLKTLTLNKPKEKLIPVYFEQILNGIVYELYFPELLQKHDREIIKHIGDLPALEESVSDEEKMRLCQEVFNRLNDKKHSLRNNLFYLDSIPEIRIIEGKEDRT